MEPAAHPQTDGEDAVHTAVRQRLRKTAVEVMPVLAFTISFGLTHRLTVALALAATLGIGVCVYRVVRGEPKRGALVALGFVCVQGVLAARSGQATNFFLPELTVNGVMVVVTPVLLVLGWPPLGLAAGLITGERSRWRRCAVRRRAFTRGNLVMLAGQVLTLSVELPLFLSGQAVALGTVHVFGPIVLALGALLGWQVYRRTVGTHRCATHLSPNAEVPHSLERTPGVTTSTSRP
ncbi:DUF3159 domain-containing protein [Streptomyces sp. NPDC048506]|uniref:DUF3159 domain-containing protein n=1 Tax=Streptomyces sp. NPDC048506 TaxID=3155028 RepID=UPI003421CF9F